MIFTISTRLLQSILADLRHQPYHVAVGAAGLSLRPRGTLEVLARSYRILDEAFVSQRPSGPHRFHLSFTSMTLDRPDIHSALGLLRSPEPTESVQCSILLGSDRALGTFAGTVQIGPNLQPIHQMRVVGPRMLVIESVGQDTALDPPTEEDCERWSRMIGAIGGTDVWVRLTQSHFVVIGTGRTGSLLAHNLASQGVRNISLIDPDRVEVHNLDAMDEVTEKDVGRYKSQVVAQSLNRRFPRTKVIAEPDSVAGPRAEGILKSADFLISSVDNDAARVACAAGAIYLKPVLDLGTGVFLHERGHRDYRGPRPRQLGADIRLILPGDGCLMCWGGVANVPNGPQAAHTVSADFRDQRAGSLRSLNQIATGLGLRLVEDLFAGRVSRSTWLRFDTDHNGVPTVQQLQGTPSPGCGICKLTGMGDLVVGSALVTP